MGIAQFVPKALIGAGSRPASIYCKGVTYYVHEHDAWYGSRVHRLHTLMKEMHPDNVTRQKKSAYQDHDRHLSIGAALVKRGCKLGAKFREAARALSGFKKQELRWYANLGLRPPRVSTRGLSRGVLNKEMMTGTRTERTAYFRSLVNGEHLTAAYMRSNSS